MIFIEYIISNLKRNHGLISVLTWSGSGIDIVPGYNAKQEVVLL